MGKKMSAEIKRVIIMRGIPGSGKSTAAKWLASLVGKAGDELWLEKKILYYGRPSLAFKTTESAKSGIEYDDVEGESLYGHEPVIRSVIHSTDQFFVNDEGTYRFSPKGLWPNHNKNYKAFRDSVDAEVPLVIVDNTNTQSREWKKYQDYAEDSGYWVSFHVMPHPSIKEASERNTHGVPADKIEQMIKRFQ
jgi:tRNA uridine 5-carbamoylmethylation protein Kti12